MGRGVQDELSSEVWRHLNNFYLTLMSKNVSDLMGGPHQLLRHIFRQQAIWEQYLEGTGEIQLFKELYAQRNTYAFLELVTCETASVYW